MNLNSIELPDFLVRELYRDQLIEPTPGMTTGRSPRTRTETATILPPNRPASPAIPASPATSQAAVSPKPAPEAPAAPSLPQSPAADTLPAYKFLGLNRKKITVLVQSPGVAFLPDDQLAFLTKMLEACRMNIGDVAIVNQAVSPANITAIKQQLQPSFMLLFGIQPVDIKLPINFPLFKIQTYDQCTYLYASSLNELVSVSDESKVLKGKLWGCLKTMFEI